jgi:hypothetical protein
MWILNISTSRGHLGCSSFYDYYSNERRFMTSVGNLPTKPARRRHVFIFAKKHLTEKQLTHSEE